MKKIGLIGCGAVAGYGHLPSILEVQDLKLHALLDPNEDNLNRAKAQTGAPGAFTDAEAFFKSGIEAVTITSPAPCHIDNVLAAARHKLPVLCEKPLAMTRSESETMIAAMKKAGVSLHTAVCYRFSPSALKIREWVAAGAIGKARSLRLIYNWDCHGKYVTGPDGTRMIQKRREGRMLEGGPMVDCGTHQIDLALFWLGSDVVRYTGHGAWADDYEAPDHMWLHLDHANGAHTLVEISYSYYHTSPYKRNEFVYELIGTEGAIRYDRGARSLTLADGSGLHTAEFHEEKNFTGLYAEWSRVLHGQASDLLTSAEAGMRVADIAREATNQAIALRVSGPA
jgi:predicted dehydrogenase